MWLPRGLPRGRFLWQVAGCMSRVAHSYVTKIGSDLRDNSGQLLRCKMHSVSRVPLHILELPRESCGRVAGELRESCGRAAGELRESCHGDGSCGRSLLFQQTDSSFLGQGVELSRGLFSWQVRGKVGAGTWVMEGGSEVERSRTGAGRWGRTVPGTRAPGKEWKEVPAACAGLPYLFMPTGGSVWGMVLPRNATGLLLVVSGCEVFKMLHRDAELPRGRFLWQEPSARGPGNEWKKAPCRCGRDLLS